jgi:hypothetical protein
MQAILEHEPKGPRTFLSGKRKLMRRKDDYSFKVLWKDIAQDESNPSWEPWSNESLRSSHLFEEYCKRPEVMADLGADFALEQDAAVEQQSKRRRN